MIVPYLYMLDRQKHVECISDHQQATPLLTVGYFPSIPPKQNA